MNEISIKNTIIFIQENALKYVICKMSSILFRLRCVEWDNYVNSLRSSRSTTYEFCGINTNVFTQYNKEHRKKQSIVIDVIRYTHVSCSKKNMHNDMLLFLLAKMWTVDQSVCCKVFVALELGLLKFRSLYESRR